MANHGIPVYARFSVQCDMPMDVVVLAAGQGRRLRSAMPKPLMPLAGAPLLAHVLKAARRLSPRRLIVVSPPQTAAQTAFLALDSGIVCAPQASAGGTADALHCALPMLPKDGMTLVLCADAPLLPTATMRRLSRAVAGGAPAMLTFVTDRKGDYGRVVRAANGRIARIVEAKDADAATAKIGEGYAGAMAAPTSWLRMALPRIDDMNAVGERYLTDLAALAAADGIAAKAVRADAEDCFGVNTAEDLERAERICRRRQAAVLLRRGVRIVDAERIDIRGDVSIGRDALIDVNVVFSGVVKIGVGCHIGAHCVIDNCRIGANSFIEPFSHLVGAVVGRSCRIGPYARLRPGASLADDVKIGNFVEVKKSVLAAGVKAGHLAYLGDSVIGRNVNIGAGVITCNYDGRRKHRTVIGDGAFIGSDVQIIAPLTIGARAYVAAGSTITRSVDANTLTLSRAPQTMRKLRRKR